MPTGHWGDRFGSRGVIARIVVWWSAFTALTGAAVGLWSLLAVRFLFGAGEKQGYPPLDCWSPVFDAVAAGLAGGAVCWLLVDATRSVVEPRGGGTG